MAISLTCDCGRSLRIKDELAGRKVRCPECREVLPVPEPGRAPEVEDELLEALPAARGREMGRRSAIQSQPSRSEGDGGVALLTTEPAPRPRPRVRLERERPRLERQRPRLEPRATLEQGWFGNTNGGVVGGLLMMLIAVVWFVGGLMGGIIFFYPPLLLVIGLISLVKGLTDNT